MYIYIDIPYLISVFGLKSSFSRGIQKWDKVAIENNDTPDKHSKHTNPICRYGKTLNSKFKSTTKPMGSLSTPISNHTTGNVTSSYGFKLLLNFVFSMSKFICILVWVAIGTPSCYKNHRYIFRF